MILLGCDAPKEEPAPVPKPVPITPTAVPSPKPKPSPQTPKVAHPDRVYQLTDLEKVSIGTPRGAVEAWVMDTVGKREEGMMFLKPAEVKDSQGMIFVFDKDQDVANAFWMKDTPTPLDIIFVAANGSVINIGKGMAFSEDQVKPRAAYKYVLELKQGVGAKYGLKPGAKIKIPSSVVAEN